MHISWARLASFCHLGFISDPLIVSKFHNETHDPKGQENKIYTIAKGRETFYRRHTVPVTGCSEVKYVLKRVSFGSIDCTDELILECAYFLGRLASFCHLGFISDPLIVSKFHNETHDPKEQENKIYTIVKGRETFYRRHTVPVTSCSEVNVFLKGYPLDTLLNLVNLKSLRLEVLFRMINSSNYWKVDLKYITSKNIIISFSVKHKFWACKRNVSLKETSQ